MAVPKAIKIGFFTVAGCLLLAGGIFLQRNPLISGWVADAYWVWRNYDGDRLRQPDEYDGTVVKVLDGNWFHLRHPEGYTYGVRVLGMLAPGLVGNTNTSNRALALLSRTNLAELILDRNVTIDVVRMGENRYGEAFVYLGETNVAGSMLEAGMAKVVRDDLLVLPRIERLRLLTAERRPRLERRGVWGDGENPVWDRTYPLVDPLGRRRPLPSSEVKNESDEGIDSPEALNPTL